MDWFLTPMQKYAVFSGRSRRKEYWMFVLFLFAISIVLSLIDMAIGTYNDVSGIGLLQGLFHLVTFVPFISLTARRFHDIGKSGWMQLLFVIPLVGFILWIVWMAKAGDAGDNQYGPDPKALSIQSQDGPALA